MAKTAEVGERALVDNIRSIIRPRSRDVVIGPGDDAAVVRCKGDAVMSTDILTAERHFPEGMTYEQFGWSAAAVSFSDIAAMGAKPAGFLSAVTIPGDEDESSLYDLVSGIDQCCEFAKTEIIGGDTKFGPLSVTGTAFGCMEGRKPMTRRGARPGDIVAVTGSLGNAAAGYYALKDGIEAEDQILALMLPVPRVEYGIRLASTGIVSSCMDLSDGLGNAAHTVCRDSHVGMEIEWEFLPVDEESLEILESCHVDPEDGVIGWGGDYELMFTFDRTEIQKLYDANIQFSIIGLVDNGDGPVLNRDDHRKVMRNGIY